MADSVGVGKIFGIEIELHWTFLALLLLLFISSAYYIFVLIVLLFICVFLHELSHSVVSLRNGIKVRKIILLPLGGASIIDQINIDPRVEFNIAIAGPLMSFLLGSLFGTLTAIFPAGIILKILQSLFLLNVLLGIFNLLPAFPTDGGRVFRSYLERRYDEYKATMMTVTVSKYVMVLFIVGTVFYLYLITAPASYKDFFFLWNLLIVVFLYGGAKAEQEVMEIRRSAEGVDVKDVLSKHFGFVDSNKKVQELYSVVKKTKEHVLITRIGGEYAYVDLLGRERLNVAESVADISTKIPSVTTKTNVVDAFEMMESGGAGIAAVTDKNKLVGVITISHLQAFLSLHVINRRKKKDFKE